MKSCLFFLIFTCTIFTVHSQNNKTMVDSITAPIPGKGKITIQEDAGITNLIGKINTSGASAKSASTTVVKRGYRIQIYSGSQKQTAKDEAYARERKFKSRFPEYSTYISFNSPFWKLRVGDFTDRNEAEDALNEIKKGCPEYSNDLYIVLDNVKVAE